MMMMMMMMRGHMHIYKDAMLLLLNRVQVNLSLLREFSKQGISLANKASASTATIRETTSGSAHAYTVSAWNSVVAFDSRCI